jgi:hypothetical protein
MPLGVAAAAASAPAPVKANASAAIAAVRRPLHRGGEAPAATATGASWMTRSWTSTGGCGCTGIGWVTGEDWFGTAYQDGGGTEGSAEFGEATGEVAGGLTEFSEGTGGRSGAFGEGAGAETGSGTTAPCRLTLWRTCGRVIARLGAAATLTTDRPQE